MAIPIYETIRLELGDRIGFPLLEQFVNLSTPALAIVMEQQLVVIKSSLKFNEKIFYQRDLITQSGTRQRNKFYNSSWNQWTLPIFHFMSDLDFVDVYAWPRVTQGNYLLTIVCVNDLRYIVITSRIFARRTTSYHQCLYKNEISLRYSSHVN